MQSVGALHGHLDEVFYQPIYKDFKENKYKVLNECIKIIGTSTFVAFATYWISSRLQINCFKIGNYTVSIWQSGLFGPIAEELTFRCLFPYLINLYQKHVNQGKDVSANELERQAVRCLHISTALFTAMHLDSHPLADLPLIYLYGWGLGCIAQQDKSAQRPLLLHSCFNLSLFYIKHAPDTDLFLDPITSVLLVNHVYTSFIANSIVPNIYAKIQKRIYGT